MLVIRDSDLLYLPTTFTDNTSKANVYQIGTLSKSNLYIRPPHLLSLLIYLLTFFLSNLPRIPSRLPIVLIGEAEALRFNRARLVYQAIPIRKGVVV